MLFSLCLCYLIFVSGCLLFVFVLFVCFIFREGFDLLFLLCCLGVICLLLDFGRVFSLLYLFYYYYLFLAGNLFLFVSFCLVFFVVCFCFLGLLFFSYFSRGWGSVSNTSLSLFLSLSLFFFWGEWNV